jgi:hypothetical protein
MSAYLPPCALSEKFSKCRIRDCPPQLPLPCKIARPPVPQTAGAPMRASRLEPTQPERFGNATRWPQIPPMNRSKRQACAWITVSLPSSPDPALRAGREIHGRRWTSIACLIFAPLPPSSCTNRLSSVNQHNIARNACCGNSPRDTHHTDGPCPYWLC